MVRRLSGLVVTAVLARLLAPTDFGLVALASLAVQLLGIITELGITSALVQRLTVNDEELSTGFWLGLGFSTVLATVGFAAAESIALLFHQPRIAPLLRAMMFILPFASLGQIGDVILQRRLDFRSIATIDWVSGMVSAGLGVSAAFAGWGLWALVVQFVSSTAVAVLLRLLMVRWRPILVFDKSVARRILGYGSSLVSMGLLNYAAVNVDNALIGAGIGAAALGYYMLAYNLVLLPSTNVGGLVSRVMFPALSTLQSDRQRFVGAYGGMLRVVSLATFPLVVGLGVTAPLAIPVIYGPQWNPSVNLLEILTVVGIFQSVNVSGVAYSAIGRPQLLLGWAMISVTVMTIGFAIGVRHGVTGVAWSYLIVSPVISIPPHLIANYLIGMRQRDFFRVVGPPLGASLFMGACLLAIRDQPLIQAPPPLVKLSLIATLGGCIYAVSLLAFAFFAGQRRTPVAWIIRPPQVSVIRLGAES